MNVSSLLAKLTPQVRDVAQWGGSRLSMDAYIHPKLPPEPLITSVRAVLVLHGRVAILRNAEGRHPVPGGRRAEGESLLDTLRREVLEETGCTFTEPKLIGFIHFRHLTPEPEGYPYPYPHFFQAVFVASVTKRGAADDPEGWEQGVEFVPIEDLEAQGLEPIHQVFVKAAFDEP